MGASNSVWEVMKFRSPLWRSLWRFGAVEADAARPPVEMAPAGGALHGSNVRDHINLCKRLCCWQSLFRRGLITAPERGRIASFE
jgi:hypothetical protein